MDTDFLPQPSEAAKFDDQADKLTAAARVMHERGDKWHSDVLFAAATEARRDARKARTT